MTKKSLQIRIDLDNNTLYDRFQIETVEKSGKTSQEGLPEVIQDVPSEDLECKVII